MRDLLTNIKKAIEILNKNKNLTISLNDPNLEIPDVPPVGVSRREWEESLENIVKSILFTDNDTGFNFDCTFNYPDLLISDTAGTLYTNTMKKIIKAIYDQYKYYKNLGCQTTAGLKSYPTGGWINTGIPINLTSSSFSNLNVTGDMEVQGGIYADDIKVNGGQLSVSSELDDLKRRNKMLEDEITSLKVLLRSNGVI